MIDAVSNLRAQPNDLASLTLVTTSNTNISPEIMAYAAERGVMLYKSVAEIDDETGEFILSDREWINRDHPRFGSYGAVLDRLRKLFFDWSKYDEYKGVDLKKYRNTTPNNNAETAPDSATIDDK